MHLNDFFSFEHATRLYFASYITCILQLYTHVFSSFNSLPVMLRKLERQRWKLALAIVRFRWLEAASGTVCRPTSSRLQC